MRRDGKGAGGRGGMGDERERMEMKGKGRRGGRSEGTGREERNVRARQ